MTDYSKAPGEWEWQVFIAVVETGGTDAAAQRLREIRRDTYGRQAVEKTINKIQRWAGESLLKRDMNRKLRPTERGQEILEGARRIVAQYRMMRREVVAPELPKLACLPLHTHFVALAEDILFHQPEEGTDKVVVEYLPQDQRGEGKFHGQAVEMLDSNVYQLIIGPRVKDGNAFASTRLYEAQLEAMVSATYPEAGMSLADLVTRHRMLVPPPDMRSRRVLEDAIKKWVPDLDPGEDERVAGESYETATSVMRLRLESSRGRADSRVVVVASDVALAYKEGMEFGGRGADRFKWIPIYHRDDDGTEHLLRMEVCATVRRSNRERLAGIVAALRTAVERLDNLPDQVGLDGARSRQQPLPIPAPRPGERGSAPR